MSNITLAKKKVSDALAREDEILNKMNAGRSND